MLPCCTGQKRSTWAMKLKILDLYIQPQVNRASTQDRGHSGRHHIASQRGHWDLLNYQTS